MSKNPHQPANVYGVNPMVAQSRKGMQHFYPIGEEVTRDNIIFFIVLIIY